MSAEGDAVLPDSSDWTVSHDFAFAFGGAELVTSVLCSALPGAKMAYLGGRREVVEEITPSATERICPGWWTERNYRVVAPLLAGHLLPRREPVDKLLASSYAFCHWIPANRSKVVYCHTPLRQVWSAEDSYQSEGPLVQRIGTRTLSSRLRRLDLEASRTVDQFIATSRAVRDRIDRYYRPVSSVPIIPPPLSQSLADVARLHDSLGQGASKYFLWVGRIIEPYKRLSLLLDAFRDQPDERLVIVGDGRDRDALEAAAPANVVFAGWQAKDALAGYYRDAEAVIFPSEDDFGLVPIEAHCFGVPVLAFHGGGALDTVLDGFNGHFFSELSSTGVRLGISKLRGTEFNRSAIQDYVRTKYSEREFRRSILDVLSEA